VPPTIEVLKAPDDAQPIGTALCVGMSEGGIAIWRLIVHGAALRHRWIVVDRRFRRAEPGIEIGGPGAGRWHAGDGPEKAPDRRAPAPQTTPNLWGSVVR
jgi:hypothetical protein